MLKKEFNHIKKTKYPWVMEVSKYVCQQPFIQLDRAYKRFFQGIARRPKLKNKGRSKDSFYIGGDQIKVDGKRIWVPNLGWIKLKENLRKNTAIRSGTFSRKANRWFVSIQIETEVEKITPSAKSVGIDLGINTMAQFSDGIGVRSPQPLKTELKSLKKHQRKLCKKKFRSNNYYKQKQKIERLHYKITNIRKDNLHKLTTYLVETYQNIAIEDLNVSGMLKNHKLARSIADLGFYEFRRQLEYKSKIYGNVLFVADRFFASSKTCSQCGIKKDLSLKDREFSCGCGLKIDRDLNAAINLEQKMTQIRQAVPEFTPREMTAIDLWKISINQTSIEELGNKHQTLCG